MPEDDGTIESGTPQQKRSVKKLIPKPKPWSKAKGRKHRWWVFAVAVATALVLAVAWLVQGVVLRELWLAVIAVFFLALWMVVGERSTKEVGVALVTGLVLAGSAFVLNELLDDALTSRDQGQRQTEVRLAINRGDQTTFRGEDLSGLDLSNLDMSAPADDPFDLSFSDLTKARLVSANLQHAQLRRATLEDADFTGADLSNAVLRGAILTKTTFCQADLSGADLTGASGFAESEGCDPRRRVVLDANSKCPGLENDVLAGEVTEPTFQNGRFTCQAIEPGSCDEEDGSDEDAECAAPVDEPVQLFLVSHSDPSGLLVGQVVGTSGDGGALSYAIKQTDCASGTFVVDPSNGVITTGQLFGRELAHLPTSCDLVVVVSDEGGNTADEAMRIVIRPAAEDRKPDAGATYLIRPDSQIGSIIGQVQPTEQADGKVVLYTVIAPADGRFRVEPGTGVLVLNHTPEPGTDHSVNIAICEKATGDDECEVEPDENDVPYSATVSVRVTVLEENAPPIIEGPDRFTIIAGDDSVDVVGSVQATDPDSDDPLNYALSDQTDDDNCGTFGQPSFKIDETGTIKLSSVGLQPGTCVLVVTVSDQGIPALSTTTRIAIEVSSPEPPGRDPVPPAEDPAVLGPTPVPPDGTGATELPDAS